MGETLGNRRRIGKKYEELAAKYFIEHGYQILERNYHAGRHGEIDLIAEDAYGTLVICECKYRKNDACGDPLESVDSRKQRKICKTALFYLYSKGYGTDRACRFDVIAIDGNDEIRHIENAFDFCI